MDEIYEAQVKTLGRKLYEAAKEYSPSVVRKSQRWRPIFYGLAAAYYSEQISTGFFSATQVRHGVCEFGGGHSTSRIPNCLKICQAWGMIEVVSSTYPKTYRLGDVIND
tara:strand:+ start:590 stop:916 length:327 start_codon:yes stop_codon:yes gene_type:complete